MLDPAAVQQAIVDGSRLGDRAFDDMLPVGLDGHPQP
jgi:hypothetical protein